MYNSHNCCSIWGGQINIIWWAAKLIGWVERMMENFPSVAMVADKKSRVDPRWAVVAKLILSPNWESQRVKNDKLRVREGGREGGGGGWGGGRSWSEVTTTDHNTGVIRTSVTSQSSLSVRKHSGQNSRLGYNLSEWLLARTFHCTGSIFFHPVIFDKKSLLTTAPLSVTEVVCGNANLLVRHDLMLITSI